MKRSRAWIRPAILAALLLALGWWLYLEHIDPRYNGRRTSEWLVELDNGSQEYEAEKAIDALGQRALPQISKFFHTERISRQEHIFDWVEKYTDWTIQRDNPVRRHYMAMDAVKILGGRAAPVADQMIESIVNEDLRMPGLTCLMYMGRSALPSLKRALNHSNREVKLIAMCLLAELRATDVIPAYIQIFKQGDNELKLVALEALAVVHDSPDAVLLMLQPLLSDKDEKTRASAVNALGALAEQKADLIAPFCAFSKDSSDLVRQKVAIRSWRFCSGNNAAVDALIEGLSDKDHKVRNCANAGLQVILGIYLRFPGYMHHPMDYHWGGFFHPDVKLHAINPGRLFEKTGQVVKALSADPNTDMTAASMSCLDPKFQKTAQEILQVLNAAELTTRSFNESRIVVLAEKDKEFVEKQLLALHRIDAKKADSLIKLYGYRCYPMVSDFRLKAAP